MNLKNRTLFLLHLDFLNQNMRKCNVFPLKKLLFNLVSKILFIVYRYLLLLNHFNYYDLLLCLLMIINLLILNRHHFHYLLHYLLHLIFFLHLMIEVYHQKLIILISLKFRLYFFILIMMK